MNRFTSPPRSLVALHLIALTALAACAPESTAPTAGLAGERPEPAIRSSVTGSSGSLQLASLNTAGRTSATSSTTCDISADGSRVLFASTAADLVGGDSNGAQDLFMRDLTSGVTTRVSAGAGGAQLPRGGNCLGTSMTPDGHYVAFNSEIDGGTVYVKNTVTGELRVVSPTPGTVPQVTGFFGGVLSDDGARVVFLTFPQQRYVGAYTWVNLVPARLMLRDLRTGNLETLPTDNGIVAAGEIIGTRFAISPDGQRVAFVSSSSTLSADDTNGRPDLFVMDLQDRTTVVASSTGSGVPAVGGGTYWRPAFASNTLLAFGTGQNSSLGERGYYVKDLVSGSLRLVLRDSDGGSSAVLSGDARSVVFARTYSGFSTRIVLRDLRSGAETLISASTSGTASNGTATGAVIARGGTQVAFGSNASNLVSPRPLSGVFQIYVKAIAPAGASLF